MLIRFGGPVAKLLGVSEYLLPLQRSVTVNEVISLLAAEFSDAAVFKEHPDGGEIVPYVWMALKNRTVLVQPQEVLEDGDELYFIPTMMGG